MAQMRQVASDSNMPDIVFMTVVGQGVFTQPWNQTDDMFEEPQPGELQLFPLVPLDPSEVTNEWNIIRKAYNKCPQCNKPAPTTPTPQPEDETTTSPQ
ncbi:hypothetical protein ACROYT_G042984 [Oculina patagonica]